MMEIRVQLNAVDDLNCCMTIQKPKTILMLPSPSCSAQLLMRTDNHRHVTGSCKWKLCRQSWGHQQTTRFPIITK